MAHSSPLRTLTGVDEHRPGTNIPGLRSDHTGRRFAGRQCPQSGHRPGPVGRADSAEDRMVGPVVIECVRDIGQRHRRADTGHPIGQCGGHLGHPFGALSGDHQGTHRRRRGHFGHAHLGCLFKHDVSIRSAETE